MQAHSKAVGDSLNFESFRTEREMRAFTVNSTIVEVQ